VQGEPSGRTGNAHGAQSAVQEMGVGSLDGQRREVPRHTQETPFLYSFVTEKFFYLFGAPEFR